MKLRLIWHRIVRKFTPPGNRAPIEESYRQPNMDPEHQMSGGTAAQHGGANSVSGPGV
jgi:hypothetical protein